VEFGLPRTFRRRCLLVALCVAAFANADVAVFAQPDKQSGAVQSSHSETVTLDRAVALACQYNYQLCVSREEIPRTEKLIAAARTEAFPQFRVLALPGQELTDPGKGNLLFFGLASQPLTQLYRVGIGINVERLQRNMARQTVRLRLQQAVNSVKITYYSILEREDAIKSVEEQIKYLTELTHVVEGLVVTGAALDVDLLEVRARSASTQFELEDLRDALATDKDQLNHLMGRDPRIAVSVVAVPSIMQSDEEMSAAESQAIKQRPELQEQQILVRKILQQRKYELSKYIPDISAAFTSIETKNLDITFPRNYLAFGAFVNYDLWDWGKKIDLADADSIQAREERLNLSDLIDRVLIDVRDKCRKMHLARQRLEVATIQREAAKERLRVDTRRLQVGATLLSQVLESQAALAKANLQYSDATLALWSARSELDRAIGRDII
jgi:outer membrane protein TolC